MNRIKQFTFLENYHNILEKLNEEEKAKILLKIYNFMYKNIEPVFDKKEENDKEELAWLGVISSLKNSKKQSFNRTKPKRNQKETKKKPKQNQSPSTSTSYSYINNNTNLEDRGMGKGTFVDIYTYYQNNIGQMSSTAFGEFEEWRKTFTDEVLKLVIDTAIDNDAKTWKYIDGILINLQNQELITLEQIKTDREKRKNKKRYSSVQKWMDKPIEKELATEEEQKELKEFLKEFKEGNERIGK